MLQGARTFACDGKMGKKYDLRSTVPMKMEYEMKRRKKNTRASIAFPNIFADPCLPLSPHLPTFYQPVLKK